MCSSTIRNYLSRPLYRLLDKQIAAGLHFRGQLEMLWNRSFKPMRVGTNPPAWLLLEPERIRVGALRAQDNTLSLPLGIDVRARVVTEDTAPEVRTVPLPGPEALAHSLNRFSFTVPVLLPYEEAAGLALSSLRQKPPHIGGASVRFKKLEFIPSG
jgi:hypothetical protein